MFNFEVLTALLVAAPVTQATIAGLTYMDDMDFQERYRNVHECDPFYYHPLHLPEHCVDMYEKLIRSRIGSLGAPKAIKEKKYQRYPDYDYEDDVKVEYRKLTPYEEMLLSLNIDVEQNPGNSQVVWSNLGPVAVYRLPISQDTKNGIHEYFKKFIPKRKNGNRKEFKMDFTYGKHNIEVNVDRKNDNFVIIDS